jgi:uncharacterized membrane protein YeaQ/YmgE (transglycosylase-associated protein family)
VSVLVWAMVGLAIWHLAVLVPDKFTGGIIGAFLAAVAGALISGYVLPTPGIPTSNPPGLAEGLWPIPGAVAALVALYLHGARQEARIAAAGESSAS